MGFMDKVFNKKEEKIENITAGLAQEGMNNVVSEGTEKFLIQARAQAEKNIAEKGDIDPYFKNLKNNKVAYENYVQMLAKRLSGEGEEVGSHGYASK